MEGLSPNGLLDCFISGLHKELQRDIIPWQPESLTKAFTLAKLFEEKYSSAPQYFKQKFPLYPDISTITKTATLMGPSPPLAHSKPLTTASPYKLPAANGPPTNSAQFKKITVNEMQLRRAKGLCFNYDAKYSLTHQCPNERLLLLQWEEESSEADATDYIIAPSPTLELEKEVQSLSLNAMDSNSISGTMKFQGTLNGHPVQNLLDGGSDDNFIQPRLVKFLHLEVIPTPCFKVLVGDGISLQVEGLLSNLQILV